MIPKKLFKSKPIKFSTYYADISVSNEKGFYFKKLKNAYFITSILKIKAIFILNKTVDLAKLESL